jgi:Lipocalin-like domain
MASNPLIGTWRLLSWENRSVEDGQLSYPHGEDATGYIIYNEDGYMFVAIMAPQRLIFAHDDLLSATKEEEALAEETYLSYSRTPGRSEGRKVDVEHASAVA